MKISIPLHRKQYWYFGDDKQLNPWNKSTHNYISGSYSRVVLTQRVSIATTTYWLSNYSMPIINLRILGRMQTMLTELNATFTSKTLVIGKIGILSVSGKKSVWKSVYRYSIGICPKLSVFFRKIGISGNAVQKCHVLGISSF